MIPEPAARYLANHPEAALRMDVSNTKELLRKLDGGEIDFALVEGNFAKSEYEHLVYATEPYIAVCGADHAFRTEVHKIEDLTGGADHFAGSGIGHTGDIGTVSRGAKPHAGRLRILSRSAISMRSKHLSGKNCGITFLYEAAGAQRAMRRHSEKDSAGGVFLTHDLTFIWRKGACFPKITGKYSLNCRKLRALRAEWKRGRTSGPGRKK